MDEADRHWVEEVALLATDLHRREKARLLEDPEVLHDAEPRHPGQVLAQLSKRLAIALEESIEEQSPPGIGQGSEDRCHRVGHRPEHM